ncbi:glycosyltransferase family 2 protein [Candidatus Gottesmanbacteria bacterium]|nr:glycosyltransferase family 2 protein [Candidatus Gottesmanbacteria bacterium]
MKSNLLISIVIPVYNEEKSIKFCLSSLESQTYKPLEIILVDDGSSDNSQKIIQKYLDEKGMLAKIIFLQSSHQGTAKARNLGVSRASGEILVFVDGDMIFAQNFVDELTKPIRGQKSRGTFTKAEYVENWNNPWARSWNYNEGISSKRRIPQDYPDKSPVFRAIKTMEFRKVGGFDDIGFTDDWTLSRKLGYLASVTTAVCYHKNPSSILEVYAQARWIGKNEFITGSFPRIIFNLIRYNPLFQVFNGVILGVKFRHFYQIPFQLIYSIAVIQSIVGSVFGEVKYKR